MRETKKMNIEAAKKARKRTQNHRAAANKMGEAGIFDWVRFRGEEDARSFARLLEAITEEAFVIVRKTHRATFTGELVWLVEFAVSPMANAYIMRRVGLGQVRAELA